MQELLQHNELVNNRELINKMMVLACYGAHCGVLTPRIKKLINACSDYFLENQDRGTDVAAPYDNGVYCAVHRSK